jgi:hypothetical protein
MSPISRFLCAAIAIAMAVTCGPPASAQRMSSAAGKVLNDVDDKPVRGAEVSIPGLGLRTTSDSTGAFRLVGVPAGRQIVWVRKIGFSPLSAVLTFVAGETLDNDFGLVPASTRLPEVTVRVPAPVAPKLTEFEERRLAGVGGHFLTGAQLEKMEGRRMSEIMATIPGPSIVRGTTNAAWIAGGRMPRGGSSLTEMDRRRGANPGACYSAVVLDGTFVYTGNFGEALWDINSIQPAQIAGVEVYTSGATIPSKYNGTRSTCGLVVIWTR